MISIPLDESYLYWLYSQVGEVDSRNPSATYWNLLRRLYQTQFIWFIPNDDNRVEDGIALRYEFIEDLALEGVSIDWLHMECSFLELLIGLSRRLAFETEGESRWWFWRLLSNLGLEGYSDDRPLNARAVNTATNRVIWREYTRNGVGGLFPLHHAREDQTEVEMWRQLGAYLLEQD